MIVWWLFSRLWVCSTIPNVWHHCKLSIRCLSLYDIHVTYHVLADVINNVESNPWLVATVSLSVITGLLVIAAVILLIVVIKLRTGRLYDITRSKPSNSLFFITKASFIKHSRFSVSTAVFHWHFCLLCLFRIFRHVTFTQVSPTSILLCNWFRPGCLLTFLLLTLLRLNFSLLVSNSNFLK